MQISDFSLEAISEAKTTMPDNPLGTVIHAMLHASDELNDTVRDCEEVRKDLNDNERAVLKPVDFTDDWKRQRDRFARKGRIDEEEELELELEYLRKIKSKNDSDEDDGENLPPLVSQTMEEEKPSFFKIQKKPEPEPIRAQQPAPVAEERKPAEEEKVEAPAESFVPFGPGATGPVQSVELDAIKKSKEEKTRAVEREDGFKKGYEEGVAKAQAELEEHFGEISKNVNEALSELEGLKKSILHNAQENFFVLCQALIESLLKKEFSLDPTSFLKVVQRAIDETIKDDNYKVKVNSKTYKELVENLDAASKQKFVKDDSVKDNDFKIESKSAVVDGNIHKIVQDMLESADLNLFESSGKVV